MQGFFHISNAMLLINVTCILIEQVKFEDFETPFVNAYRGWMKYPIFSNLLVIYNDILARLDCSKMPGSMKDGWISHYQNTKKTRYFLSLVSAVLCVPFKS